MTRLRDIMTTQLIVVAPDLTLRDLVDLLAARQVSGVPVVSGATPVGVVTLDDIAAFQASLPVVPTEGSDELGGDDEPPPASTEGEEADGAFYQDLWADAGADLVERFEAVRSPEWDLLGEHTVEEAMTRKLHTASPDEPVETAARRMTEARIHRLLVLDEGRLCGIVTTSDITRAVAERRV